MVGLVSFLIAFHVFWAAEDSNPELPTLKDKNKQTNKGISKQCSLEPDRAENSLWKCLPHYNHMAKEPFSCKAAQTKQETDLPPTSPPSQGQHPDSQGSTLIPRGSTLISRGSSISWHNRELISHPPTDGGGTVPLFLLTGVGKRSRIFLSLPTHSPTPCEAEMIAQWMYILLCPAFTLSVTSFFNGFIFIIFNPFPLVSSLEVKHREITRY